MEAERTSPRSLRDMFETTDVGELTGKGLARRGMRSLEGTLVTDRRSKGRCRVFSSF